MNGGRKKGFGFSSTPEEEKKDENSEISRITQSKSRINRLRRSPRASQPQPRSQEPPNSSSSAPVFKTPTRPPTRLQKGRFRSSNNDESPNNDSEFQHDIIWDSNSPATPHRNGRGRRRVTNVRLVDISEIVNRIAPKSRRPEEAESSLLQWIGDSAIPCTPEVQEPRTKPKSARPNVVDDLLKLAKQFDFNMIQQDEPRLQTRQQSSVEAMDEDQELFYDGNHQSPSPQKESEADRVLLGLEEPETNGINDPIGDAALGQEMEDDLDLLFDGSTQQISGCLSQGWSGHSQDRLKITQGTAAPNGNSSGSTSAPNVPTVAAELCRNSNNQTLAAGGVGASQTGIAGMSATLSNSRQVSSANDFDDDWSNDDLLDDSLVFEMTQNPQLFSAPHYSSTQKQMNKNGSSFTNNMNGTYPDRQAGNEEKSSTSRGSNQKPRNRQSFQLDHNFSHQWNKASGELSNNSNILGSAKSSQQRHVLSSNKALSVVLGSGNSTSDQLQCSISKASVQPQQLNKVPNTSGTAKLGVQVGTKNSLISSSASNRLVPTSSSFWPDKKIEVIEEKQSQRSAEEHGLSDIADEDLDSIFASDDIWDDGTDDDDLFLEACEKVEEFKTDPDAPLETSVAKPPTKNNSAQSRTLVSSTETSRNINASTCSKQDGMFLRPHPPNNWTNNSNPAGKHNSFSACAPLLTQKPALSKANTLHSRIMPVGNAPDNSTNSSSTSCKGPYKFTHIKNTSGTWGGAFNAGSQQRISERGAVMANQSANQSTVPDDQQFKKPYSTFSAAPAVTKDVSMTVVSRCSDAEIEQKRQQAMERRRLRMTASQNLRAPI